MAEGTIKAEIRKTQNYSAFSFQRVGNTVFVRAVGSKLNPTTQWETVATVAEEFRPPSGVIALVSWGGYMNVNGGVKISPSGELQVYASSAQSSADCWTTFSYYVE